MQENNPVPTPEAPTPVVVEQPKQNNFLTILLSVLLVVSVAISVFFAFQTQKIVKELTLLKSEQKVVVEATTEPAVTESTEADPTAEWKTFTDTKDHYSVKYPTNSGLSFIDCSKSATNNNYNFVLVEKENTGCDGQGEGWIITSEGSSDCSSTESWESVSSQIVINNINAVKCTHTFIGEQLYSGSSNRINVTFSNGGQNISFDLKDLKYSELFDHILSTFKFLD